MNDQKLLEFYLSMREPESYQWNISPRSLYLELETRDFFARHFEVFDGMNVINIGIGVGEWDDYLGYILNGLGRLTSIDIDQEICNIFRYRQRREGHPNSSNIICEDFLTCKLQKMDYDLVTMIGSALQEIGAYREVFEKISYILKPNGHLMYMDFDKYNNKDKLQAILHEVRLEVVEMEEFNRFSNSGFYCMKIRRIDRN
ncbi:hypothetical protein J40TS1_37890 [Paenibacillus montaniterrae]|uniref:Methyltransferase domain-containing protein n=1 Tax=Paenibacillus montaniterrae TaxID=429341 RepID=A0A919YRZ8_9BACL|nr:class I SAM-dependent methyltransferase [Paenibacillus montaniterrae]GIP18147.1 hypothetical protein J40TS1_37890 [Paenibacillus montaniterrae]